MRLQRARGRVSVALTLAVVCGSLGGATPTFAGSALPGECPQIEPPSGATAGRTGGGWTVARGSTPQRFRYEVLGTIPDAIAPDRDLIVIEIRDAHGSDFIAKAGGAWAGMSGSPIYLDGKLLGALAYGFAAASNIAGVTPAADMLKLVGSGAPAAVLHGADRVNVPTEMRTLLADRTGASPAQVSTLERLPVPVAVSGLNAAGRQRLQEALDDRGMSAFVVPSASVAASGALTVAARPQAGGNFAGVISYGDLTVGGIGTTTYVCGDDALAFGHPMLWSGRTAYGANDANALAVVSDPVFGSYKLATIGELFGTVEEDRLAAIRADLTSAPKTRPVTSRVVNRDTGDARNGSTLVTLNDWVPDVTAFHLLVNTDSVFDRLGGGSSRLKWTVTGRRANGSPWELSYANRYASQFDIAFESIFQLYEQLAVIANNPFEKVTFTGVDISASFEEALKQLAIERVEISVNGGPYRKRRMLSVSPGDQLDVRIWLRQYRGDLVRRKMSLMVPFDAMPGFGSLMIHGATGEFGSDPTGNASSFPELLDNLAAAPTNNTLSVVLATFGFDGNVSEVRSTRDLASVVSGFVEIPVDIAP